MLFRSIITSLRHPDREARRLRIRLQRNEKPQVGANSNKTRLRLNGREPERAFNDQRDRRIGGHDVCQSSLTAPVITVAAVESKQLKLTRLLAADLGKHSAAFLDLKIMRRALRAVGADRWSRGSRHTALWVPALFLCHPGLPALPVRAAQAALCPC